MRKLADLMTSEIDEVNAIIDYELNPDSQMKLPEIGKLSLESQQPSVSRRFGGIQVILEDGDDQKNIFSTSDANIFD